MAVNHTPPTLIIGYLFKPESGLKNTSLKNVIPPKETSLLSDIAKGINHGFKGLIAQRGNRVYAAADARLIENNGELEIWVGIWLDRGEETRNSELRFKSLDEITKNYRDKVLNAFSHLGEIAKREETAGTTKIVAQSPKEGDYYEIADPKTFHIATALRTNKSRTEPTNLTLFIDGKRRIVTVPAVTTKGYPDDVESVDEFTIHGLNDNKKTLELTDSKGRARKAAYEGILEDELKEAFSKSYRTTLKYTISGRYVNGDFDTEQFNVKEVLDYEENKPMTLF